MYEKFEMYEKVAHIASIDHTDPFNEQFVLIIYNGNAYLGRN